MKEVNMTVTLTAETASEYDFVVVLDASGSMGYGSTRFAGKSRWQEAQESIFGIASALNQFDSDGIDVIVFGGDVKVFEGVTPDKVEEVFKSRSPRGGTPLAEALAALDDLAADGKKTIAIVFTDGVPDDKAAAIAQIERIADKQEADENFTILFVQIGDDQDAAKFLTKLDDDLNCKFDIVDAITAVEADKLEPLDLINKALND